MRRDGSPRTSDGSPSCWGRGSESRAMVQEHRHAIAVAVPASGSSLLIEPTGARPGLWDSRPPRCRCRSGTKGAVREPPGTAPGRKRTATLNVPAAASATASARSGAARPCARRSRAHAAATNEWRQIETKEGAKALAEAARRASAPLQTNAHPQTAGRQMKTESQWGATPCFGVVSPHRNAKSPVWSQPTTGAVRPTPLLSISPGISPDTA
jgi:hypothetical protein